MTCANVPAKAVVLSISDRGDPLPWRVRAGFDPPHRNNLGANEEAAGCAEGVLSSGWHALSLIDWSSTMQDRVEEGSRGFGYDGAGAPLASTVRQPDGSGWAGPIIKSPLACQA
jgi:hypothetical protein